MVSRTVAQARQPSSQSGLCEEEKSPKKKTMMLVWTLMLLMKEVCHLYGELKLTRL